MSLHQFDLEVRVEPPSPLTQLTNFKHIALSFKATEATLFSFGTNIKVLSVIMELLPKPKSSKSPQSIPLQPWPIGLQIQYFLKLWTLKTVVKVAIGIQRLFLNAPPSERPSLTKAYPTRPKLTNRIFIPRHHEPHNSLPLYIDIHGGGFAIGDPLFDDEYCSHLASTYHMLVISLDYPKAPIVKFPTPTQDIVAIVLSILEDITLPIDHERVVIGGFSAGGNLALSVAQAAQLRGRIHGAVLWYPVTEFVSSSQEKLASRPYRGPKDVDSLAGVLDAFKWGYVKPGQDLMDPRLSVNYARREDLPKWMFFLGAEFDSLCNEAREMVMDVAGLEGEERVAGAYAFEEGTCRWRMARGVPHGFNFPAGQRKVDEEIRIRRRDETYAEIGEWLMSGPFAKNAS